MTSPAPAENGSQRARLLLAGGITAVLVLLVVGVLLFTGEDEKHEFDPAPMACVDDWNADSATLVLGQHQATAHHYSRIQVVRFGPGGAVAPSTDTTAPCGVVFASSSLDSELAAAALIKARVGWRPLSERSVDSQALSELQFHAQAGYNALIQPNGTIDPL
jgi:hypothetical protein